MAIVARSEAFVGLDYHDSVVQVCVLDGEGEVLGNHPVSNDVNLIFEWIDKVADGREVAGVAIESCCGAASLAERLRREQWEVQLAHAGICSRMKQNPDKTDFSDAHLLADLIRVGYLPRVWLPPKAIRDLRRLGRYRQQLVNHRRNIKLRIRAMLREERITLPGEAGNTWTKPWLQCLKDLDMLAEHSRWVMNGQLEELFRVSAKIREVERRMESATKHDPVVQKLRQTKGVGLVTAVVMRAEIGSFQRFQSGKQLARYCSVTPRNVSSGKRQADGGLIKAGSLALRTMLIEAAHRLARYVPEWKAMKDRLKSRGKPAGVAVAAVANRWIRRLYWEMKDVSELNLAA